MSTEELPQCLRCDPRACSPARFGAYCYEHSAEILRGYGEELRKANGRVRELEEERDEYKSVLEEIRDTDFSGAICGDLARASLDRIDAITRTEEP